MKNILLTILFSLLIFAGLYYGLIKQEKNECAYWTSHYQQLTPLMEQQCNGYH